MSKAVVRVHTPENVDLEYSLAGIGSRAVAQIVDWLLLTLFIVLAEIAVALWGVIHPANIATPYILGAALLLTFFLIWGYFILFEYYLSGKTPGKMLLKIRVISLDGSGASFMAVLLRNLFRLVDLLPGGYLLGVIVMLVNQNERRIGDLVGGTLVIRSQTFEEFVWLDKRQREGEATDGRFFASSPDSAAPLREIRYRTLAVKKFPTTLFVADPLPLSWQRFLVNFLKRAKQMPQVRRIALAEEIWTRLWDAGLLRLKNEGPAENEDPEKTNYARNLDSRGKMKLLLALGSRLVKEQRGKRG